MERDTSESSREVSHDQLNRAMTDLERWLSTHAESGVPDCALVALLQTYASGVETLGYVPREWPDVHLTFESAETNRQQ